MTHELARQLKDAGFPNVIFKCVGNEPHLSHFEGNTKCEWDLQVEPTLSELIEVCRSAFGKLERVSNKAGFWPHSPLVVGIGFPGIQRGSTPEEAVAKLWLALNQK